MEFPSSVYRNYVWIPKIQLLTSVKVKSFMIHELLFIKVEEFWLILTQNKVLPVTRGLDEIKKS